MRSSTTGTETSSYLQASNKAVTPTELELFPNDLMNSKESIDDTDCEIKGFLHQFKLVVHLNQPVNEDSSHHLIKILLTVHVVTTKFMQNHKNGSNINSRS